MLAEQWMYGFSGAVLAREAYYPAALHAMFWPTLGWMLIHRDDGPEQQFVFHIHHFIMLWVGILHGLMFSSACKLPKFIKTDFSQYPWHFFFTFGTALLGAASYLIVIKYNLSILPPGTREPGDEFPPLPLSDSVSSQVIGVLLAIGILFFVMSLWRMFWWSAMMPVSYDSRSGNGRRQENDMAVAAANEGKTLVKYTLVLGLIILTGGVSRFRVHALIPFLLVTYIIIYLVVRFLWQESDTAIVYTPATKNSHMGKALRFTLFTGFTHMAVFIMANVSDHCFTGVTGDLPAGCSFNDAVATVFWTVLATSAFTCVLTTGMRMGYANYYRNPRGRRGQ